MRRKHEQWIDITNDLTEKGIAELKAGQILMFNKDGQRWDLKIMRNNHKRVWGKFVATYAPSEVHTEDKPAKTTN